MVNVAASATDSNCSLANGAGKSLERIQRRLPDNRGKTTIGEHKDDDVRTYASRCETNRHWEFAGSRSCLSNRAVREAFAGLSLWFLTFFGRLRAFHRQVFGNRVELCLQTFYDIWIRSRQRCVARWDRRKGRTAPSPLAGRPW